MGGWYILLGSPPRLWGKRQSEWLVLSGLRFTPTLVGKTKIKRMAMREIQVHPHACGENICGQADIDRPEGSPPRLWGKPDRHTRTRTGPRFTPTLVGKTSAVALIPARRRVHPHACGENDFEFDVACAAVGSPPRLWGKRNTKPWHARSYWFTPTLVGKTTRYQA